MLLSDQSLIKCFYALIKIGDYGKRPIFMEGGQIGYPTLVICADWFDALERTGQVKTGFMSYGRYKGIKSFYHGNLIIVRDSQVQQLYEKGKYYLKKKYGEDK